MLIVIKNYYQVLFKVFVSFFKVHNLINFRTICFQHSNTTIRVEKRDMRRAYSRPF